MVKKFLAEKGFGKAFQEYRKLQDSLKGLEKKIKKVGEERKIRKQKQDEEVTKRTGKPFKQMKDPE